MPKYIRKQGWLRKTLDEASKDIETWPDWVEEWKRRRSLIQDNSNKDDNHV